MTGGDAGKPFSFAHYLAIASCHAVNRPARINVHYTFEPSGPWWVLARPYITPVVSAEVTAIYGHALEHPAHRADVRRLEILLESGGIYLDMDVLCLRPFAPLLDLVEDDDAPDVVMGEECGVGLCNAIIVSRPGAAFLQRWLESYASFDAARWNHHAVRVPRQLADECPGLIHVVDRERFFWPMYWKDHLRAFFLRPDSQFTARSYALHLWESITWPLLRRLTPTQIWLVDCEFSDLVGPYLTPAGGPAPLPRDAGGEEERSSVLAASADLPGVLDRLGATELLGGLTCREQIDLLRAALASLDEPTRDCVTLCGIYGLSSREAGAVLDQTEASAAAGAERGRRALIDGIATRA